MPEDDGVTPLPDDRPVERFELGRIAARYLGWRIKREGVERFTATSRADDKRFLIGHSPLELECMLDNEAWKILTGRNPNLPEEA